MVTLTQTAAADKTLFLTVLGGQAGASLRLPGRAGRMRRFDGGADGCCGSCGVRRQNVVEREAVEGDGLTVDDERRTTVGLRA